MISVVPTLATLAVVYACAGIAVAWLTRSLDAADGVGFAHTAAIWPYIVLVVAFGLLVVWTMTDEIETANEEAES